MVEQIIIDTAIIIKDSLSLLIDGGIKNKGNFNISCGKLTDYNNIDIRYSNEYRETFDKIMKIKGPVVYWFEIRSNYKNSEIRNQIIEYAQQANSKSTPALKKKFDSTSTCLYVGKVKKIFWGRIIQHLGFYKVKQTQGLQLFYWAKDINLDLRVHYFEFDKELEDFVDVFEKRLAKRLNPIVGKHQ